MRICLRGIAVLATLAFVACGSKDKDKAKAKDQTGGNTPSGVAKKGSEKVATDQATPTSGATATDAVQTKAGPMAGGLLGGAPSGILGGLVGKKTGTAMSKVNLSDLFKKSKNPTADAPQISLTAKAPSVVASSKASSAALWQLAPDNAAFGLVVNDGAFIELAGATQEIERILNQYGGPGAELVKKARQGLKGRFDPFQLAAWAQKSGVDINKGMAIFMATNGDTVVVLPVTDPAAFAKSIDDKKGNLGPGHCVSQSKGRYVCSEKLAYAKAAIASVAPPIALRTAALPKWLRGDVELVAHIGSFPKAVRKLQAWKPAMSEFGTLAIAAQMNKGVLAVRGWLEGKRGGPVGSAFAKIPRAKLPKLAYGAVSWLHLRIPTALLSSKMPAKLPIGPQVDLRRDLIDNLTGEALLFTRGKKLFAEHIVLAVKNPMAARKAIDALCAVAKAKNLVDDMRTKPGGCSGSVDLGSMLASEPGMGPFVKGMPAQAVSMSIAGGGVVMLTLGETPSPKKATRTHGDPALAREYLSGTWNLFHWGMAFDPYAIAPSVVRGRLDRLIMDKMPAKPRAAINLVRWLYGHIYESGFALGLRKDGIYGLAQITTFAVDPPDVYKAYEAALLKLVTGDHAGAGPGYMSLASNSPKSLAGRHAEKVKTGVPITGQFGTAGLLGLTMWLVNRADDSKSTPPSHAKQPMPVAPPQ